MADTPTAILQAARKEVDRHTQRLIGLTVSQPAYKDINGSKEFVVDVRVGIKPTDNVVQDVVVASSVVGVVTDVNLPVSLERSASGQLRVVGRSDVMLPDLVVKSYTFNELGLLFMAGLHQDGSGNWRDGFGYLMPDPTVATGSTATHSFSVRFLLWGEKDLGQFDLGETVTEWTTT